MSIKITRQNYKKFTKSALMPDSKSVARETNADRIEIARNTDLLMQCERMYMSLQDFRDKRDECVRYFFGDQLSRMIPDPDSPDRLISIERYAIKQGMTPLKMNLVTSRLRQMVGVYEKQKLEDLTLARDRDEQKLSEMMSAAMQYIYQHNNLYRINADGYKEFLLSALPIFRTGYDFDNNRKLSDVYVDLEDDNMMFWDNNTSGLYFKNISTIGKLHEMSELEILGAFAHSPEERRAIMDAFQEIHTLPYNQQFSRDDTKRRANFYTPKDLNKYRIIEVWRREEREVLVCKDPLADEPYVIDADREMEIIAENSRRQSEIMVYGGNVEDAAVISFEYRVDTDWVVRFLTPCGHVLYQSVSPYLHGSHPWALGGYPMISGRVQSLMYDLIPAQDMVNRIIMRNEFIRMNQAKGFGIVDLDTLEDSDMTPEEFARIYTSSKGIAALRCSKAGGVNQVFARFTDEGGSGNDMAMLQTFIEFINQQSGSTNAARGEQGGSHESASRYMMETENSNNNTCDGEQWYNGLILERDNKLMMLIQQYYDSARYLNIAGSKYSEESKFYDPDKIRQTQFDLQIVQQPSSGVVRMLMNDTIATLLQYQAIDGNTALEALQGYGMDDILRIKQKNDQAAAQAMAVQQAAQQPQSIQQPVNQ